MEHKDQHREDDAVPEGTPLELLQTAGRRGNRMKEREEEGARETLNLVKAKGAQASTQH